MFIGCVFNAFVQNVDQQMLEQPWQEAQQRNHLLQQQHVSTLQLLQNTVTNPHFLNAKIQEVLFFFLNCGVLLPLSIVHFFRYQLNAHYVRIVNQNLSKAREEQRKAEFKLKQMRQIRKTAYVAFLSFPFPLCVFSLCCYLVFFLVDWERQQSPERFFVDAEVRYDELGRTTCINCSQSQQNLA